MPWGDLNVALNALVREGVIADYKTDLAESDVMPTIEVTIDKGVD